MITEMPRLVTCYIMVLNPCVDIESLEGLLQKLLRRPVKFENGTASLYTGSTDIAETVAYVANKVLSRNIDTSAYHGNDKQFYKIGVKYVGDE